MITKTELRDALAAAAQEDHLQHPQYAGHWTGDDWTVMLAARDIRLHGRTILRQGEATLATVETHRPDRGTRQLWNFHTIYAAALRIDASIPARWLREYKDECIGALPSDVNHTCWMCER